MRRNPTQHIFCLHQRVPSRLLHYGLHKLSNKCPNACSLPGRREPHHTLALYLPHKTIHISRFVYSNTHHAGLHDRNTGGPQAKREGPEGTRRGQGTRPRPEKSGSRGRGRRSLFQCHQPVRAEGDRRQASVHPLRQAATAVSRNIRVQRLNRSHRGHEQQTAAQTGWESA